MTKAPKSTKSRIPEDWRPDDAGLTFAAARGVPEDEAEAFRDYWLARGDLMASWPACWRTWCRNAVQFGRATGRPRESAEVWPILRLVNGGPDEQGPFGAKRWATLVPDSRLGTIAGEVLPCLNGYDLAGVAIDCCEAAGLEPGWRGDLSPIADWLRAGIDPETIVNVIRSGPRPNKPGAWRFWDARIRESKRA